MKHDSASGLQQERAKTDASLVSERGKTDSSLFEYRKTTETQTNAKMKFDRRMADRTRAKTRLDTDTKLVQTRAQGCSGVDSVDEIISTQALHDQRKTDDAAVINERLLMDAALLHERSLLMAEASRFLEQERSQTDKSLLVERTNTDSSAVISSNQLAVEIKSHALTKAALTTRDEFLAIVSHDLRNPLGTISSYADLILEPNSEIGKNERNFVEVVKRNALSALRLISDILDMERAVEGKLQMHITKVNLCSLLDEVSLDFQNGAQAQGISLTITPHHNPVIISCDHDRISQVLNNLIGNALKFTPSGGRVALGLKLDDSKATISVSDTGPGIPSDQLQKIFQRYFQIENANRSGLGLGLYISSMLVEAHGGELRVSSEPGHGTTFSIDLPTSMRIDEKKIQQLIFRV